MVCERLLTIEDRKRASQTKNKQVVAGADLTKLQARNRGERQIQAIANYLSCHAVKFIEELLRQASSLQDFGEVFPQNTRRSDLSLPEVRSFSGIAFQISRGGQGKVTGHLIEPD